MKANTIQQTHNHTLIGIVAATLVIYLGLTLVAGIPTGINTFFFWGGIVLLLGFLIAMLALGWHLLSRPLAPGLKAKSSTTIFSDTFRISVALWAMLASTMGTIGGIWDAGWHIKYGIPFGEDFFWMPHRFIYFSLFTPILVALYTWVQFIKRGKGTLQQRLRADIPLSLIMLGGLSMAVILPLDPLWHLIYGEDLTGLSIPHTIFTVVNAVTRIGVFTLFLGYFPRPAAWRPLFKANHAELAILLISSLNIIVMVLTLVTDWEGANRLAIASDATFMGLITARPDYSLILTMTLTAVFPTAWGAYATRLTGFSTMAWLLSFMAREGLYLLFGHQVLPETWLMLLPIVLGVDLVLWLNSRRNQPLSLPLMAAIIAVVTTLTTVPLVGILYTVPTITPTNTPIMTLAAFLTAWVALWLGRTLGDYCYQCERNPAKEGILVVNHAYWQSVLGVVSACILFTVWFIVMTDPPV
ncbi:MAG: hypothetical protein AAF614_04640 [Chloroflexota bacterium]